jgi:LL-diaminopimelate aminotransferase
MLYPTGAKRQYGINIDQEHEVVTLIGSKEGVVHFAFAYINPGDITLVSMPAYPAHFRGTILAGGVRMSCRPPT